MDDSISKCDNEQPKRTHNFTPAVRLSFKSFPGKEAFKNILPNSREETIGNLIYAMSGDIYLE